MARVENIVKARGPVHDGVSALKITAEGTTLTYGGCV
jgi:hypothetical protein